MFDPVCAVRSSRALRPSEGLDGGKEAMVARQRMKAGPGTVTGTAGTGPAAGRRCARVLVGAGLAALLALTSSGRAQELPGASPATDPAAPRPRPVGVHAALSNAIELQRRGEFEQAAVQLNLAQAQKDTLTPTEQEELARLLQANRNSLAARRQAYRLLAQAEQALRERQISRGRELVRRLTALEQAPTPPDRDRLDAVRRGLGVAPHDPSAVGDGSPQQLAHTKVQQARALLSQGNFDAAEHVAREAAALNAEFGPKEDRPEKILEDIAKARHDPRALLAASRGALQADGLGTPAAPRAGAQPGRGPFPVP